MRDGFGGRQLYKMKIKYYELPEIEESGGKKASGDESFTHNICSLFKLGLLWLGPGVSKTLVVKWHKNMEFERRGCLFPIKFILLGAVQRILPGESYFSKEYTIVFVLFVFLFGK